MYSKRCKLMVNMCLSKEKTKTENSDFEYCSNNSENSFSSTILHSNENPVLDEVAESQYSNFNLKDKQNTEGYKENVKQEENKKKSLNMVSSAGDNNITHDMHLMKEKSTAEDTDFEYSIDNFDIDISPSGKITNDINIPKDNRFLSSNIPKVFLPSKKINIIEDWLLGVEPEPICLYSKPKTSTTERNQSDVSIESDEISSLENFIDDDDDSIKDPDYVLEGSRPKKRWFVNLLAETKMGGQKRLVQNKQIGNNENDPSIAPGKQDEKEEGEPKNESLILQEHNRDISTTVNLENKPDVEKAVRKNYKDRKEFCFYCEKDVSHFSRHIFKWHSEEMDVIKALGHKVNSKERRLALSNLRKKGNFIKNRGDTLIRPVKRPNPTENASSAADYLPCKYCFGYYKRKSLFRHTKVCPSNYDKDSKTRQTSQSDGQTAMLLHTFLKHDDLLKSKIFPRMRADEVTLIVKKDPLICQYAYSYVKGRQSKGNIDFVRQNMRKLAKLLEFARMQDSNIKNLIDILCPKYFQLIISGVNKLAKYNTETENYESPTLALNFGTLLKKCCDLAYINLVQIENTSEKRKEIKILKTLIESQWCNEVSAQASTNLNQNRWNKEELLPLTSDLQKLNCFLQNSAEESFDNLKLNECDFKAYNSLKEILYTQIILLNRRRPAEVGQLKVQTFKLINLEGDGESEFVQCLTETEKILLKTYSRLVIRGKRGRGVPILLSPIMKTHFDLVLQCRENFAIDSDFVFHTTGNGFVDGTKLIQKYAKKCQLERPLCITATKLRKHLATITQLLQFSNNDMEQLSKFMGHTLHTHTNYYRLSDKVYQTAKISKLLLLMTKGGAEKYKGKTLDEIDINLDPICDEEEINCAGDDDADCPNELNIDDPIIKEDPPEKISKPKKKVCIDTKQPWTKEQKAIIAKHFSDHIKDKKPPVRIEIEELYEEYPDLFKGRKWTSIKAVVYNMYTGKLKY